MTPYELILGYYKIACQENKSKYYKGILFLF